MHRKIPHGNPNPNKHMLAFHFLRALARISQDRAGHSPPSRQTTAQQGRKIKRAAYAAVALAAGPRWAWSRAVLCSLQARARVRSLSTRRVTPRKNTRAVCPEQREGDSQVDDLRRLVPGGRMMDSCSLLEEAGNYIQCLTAQVQLMKKIADSMPKYV